MRVRFFTLHDKLGYCHNNYDSASIINRINHLPFPNNYFISSLTIANIFATISSQ